MVAPDESKCLSGQQGKPAFWDIWMCADDSPCVDRHHFPAVANARHRQLANMIGKAPDLHLSLQAALLGFVSGKVLP